MMDYTGFITTNKINKFYENINKYLDELIVLILIS